LFRPCPIRRSSFPVSRRCSNRSPRQASMTDSRLSSWPLSVPRLRCERKYPTSSRSSSATDSIKTLSWSNSCSEGCRGSTPPPSAGRVPQAVAVSPSGAWWCPRRSRPATWRAGHRPRQSPAGEDPGGWPRADHNRAPPLRGRRTGGASTAWPGVTRPAGTQRVGAHSGRNLVSPPVRGHSPPGRASRPLWSRSSSSASKVLPEARRTRRHPSSCSGR